MNFKGVCDRLPSFLDGVQTGGDLNGGEDSRDRGRNLGLFLICSF